MAIEDVIRNFDKLTGSMKRESEKALYEVGGDLLKESMQLVPFKDGDLRKSGNVRMEKAGNYPVAIVSYGDGRTPYALIRHEKKAKNYSEPGTGWKYLERPLKKKSKIYVNYIKNKIGRLL